MNTIKFIVNVSRPGRGMYQGGTYDMCARFRDERKARDYYTDMLLKYPNYEVTLERV